MGAVTYLFATDEAVIRNWKFSSDDDDSDEGGDDDNDDEKEKCHRGLQLKYHP